MGFLADFWLPILMSGVFVFVVSSIVHMVIQWHTADYAKLPDEATLLEGMRGAGVKPGHYVFPCAPSMKDMGSPEMIEKYNLGPRWNGNRPYRAFQDGPGRRRRYAISGA